MQSCSVTQITLLRQTHPLVAHLPEKAHPHELDGEKQRGKTWINSIT